MNYTVLARRYRPEDFSSLVGQSHVGVTLQSAIRMGRIGHAYLFTGPRGVGKTSAARILAKALNCEKGTSEQPCLECATCLAISKGNATDVIEVDGASNNSVDDIRDIRENANYAPLHSPYKIYIIDEVHMVTRSGFNALLKTLEEPPAHVIFIFATTEAHKIPETILSRCQRFDFRSIGEDDIASRLTHILQAENIEMEDEALRALARWADGGMRTAQSCLDQLITYAGGEKVTAVNLSDMLGLLTRREMLEVLEHAMEQRFPELIRFCDQLSGRNIRAAQVLDQIHQLLGDLMRLKHLGIEEAGKRFSEHEFALATKLVAAQSNQGFLAAIDLIQQGKTNLVRGLDPQSALEMVLLNLAHLGELPSLSDLMGQMVTAKKKTLH